MRPYRDLHVWRKAHEWVLAVYAATDRFPDEERYGVTSQLRRAAVSVPSNIAEGCGRSGPMDFARFLDIVYGSASEAEYLMLLARDLGYLSAPLYEDLAAMAEEIKRMISGLLKTVRPAGR